MSDATTGSHTTVEIDCLFADGGAAMVELCERFGGYGMYSQERVDSPIGVGLAQRHDALSNFLRTGGRTGNAGQEDVATLGARTNYFREEYAYGLQPMIDGIEPFLHHPALVEAAQAIFPDRPVIEPAIAFANVMVPGQELAVHTDVPEFRGCNRKVMPQWLLVAMHHSGLFEQHRLPIATGVSWFHDCDGGEFTCWPDGADGSARQHPVRQNTAVVLDADSVFHGVDRIAPALPTTLGASAISALVLDPRIRKAHAVVFARKVAISRPGGYFLRRPVGSAGAVGPPAVPLLQGNAGTRA